MADLPISPGAIVRWMFAGATVAFFVLGFVVDGDTRFFVASGACGTIWFAWDLVRDYVAQPMGDFLTKAASDSAAMPDIAGETIDEVIHLLEHRFASDAPAEDRIRVALRLEEMYRTLKQDPDRARAVIQRLRARVGDVAALERYAPDGSFLG